MAEKITEVQLSALVSQEIAAASSHSDSELMEKRRKALAYYRGDMRDVPALPGRSSVTSRDVPDTIGWMLPGIIRVFTASDRMAMAEPMQPGDEDAAEQASDLMGHVFFKQNDGYRILYDGTFDSLLFGNGVIKHWWDDTPETSVSEHTGLSDDALAQLLDDPDVKVLAHSMEEREEFTQDPMTGEAMPVLVAEHAVKIERTTSSGRIRVDCFPSERFLKDDQSRTIDEARFVGHTELVSRSQLVEMGFDRDKVAATSPANLDTPEEAERGTSTELSSAADESMTLVELTECYLKVDVDGDGVAEMVRAYFVGAGEAGTLLDWEVWEDDVPFSDIPCTPMPHRWEAQGIYEETADVQRVKTVLTRQMLDNLYATNLPQRLAKGKIHNPDELYNPSFGGTVFGDASAEIIPLTVPFVADKALMGIEYQDQVIERRTGVSRSTMALDPEALQNQTATSVQASRDAAYSQIELIARNQAELGWKRVFRAILRLLVQHQDRPMTIRLRDKWVEMDPRSWNADMDISINVGLGTGSRDRDISMLNAVLMTQTGFFDRFVQASMLPEAADMLSKALNTAKKLAESSGLRSPEQFFPEMPKERVEQVVQEAQQRASQPDPKTQIEQQKLQLDMQAKTADFQFRQQESQAQLQADMMRAEQEAGLKREQMAAELDLKREQLAAELQLKRELAYADLEVKRQIGHMGAQAKVDAATSKVSVGGEPG